jgi:translation initiation factor IF-2
MNGKITNKAKVKVFRGEEMVHEGSLSSLRRFKDDVKEVTTGFECGISIEGFDDIKEGDQLEAYIMEAVAQKLED